MSRFTANQRVGISIRALSMLASLILHAAVLATAALLIGESGTGPAESSSTLHVSVERAEPADDSPRDNPALDISRQISEQPQTTPSKPKEIVNTTQSQPQPIKVRVAATKTHTQQKPKPTPAQEQSSGSKPTADKKGANVAEKKPMQIAKTGKHARLSRDYQSRLQRLVERNKYYPLQARRRGIQGMATVSFTVNRSGKIERIVISRSSGRSILDQAAIKTIQRIGKAPPFPDAIKRTQWRFDMPIAYNLR